MIDEEERGIEAGQQGERLFSKDFLLVCLISLACYMSFQFLLPTLPLYMKSLGGQDAEIGLILGIYSISVLAARFLAGRALDSWGARWLLMAGASLYLVAMLLYNVATTVPAILLLRLFHGLGFGLVTTGCWGLAADLAPPSRRGEALGYFGNFSSVAMALGPGIALWLISAPGLPLGGFALLFAACALVGALQLPLALFIGETRQPGRWRKAPADSRAAHGLLCRDAVPFAITMFFAAFATGAILSFVPVHLATENTQNVSVFFFVYALVMTISRPFIGMLADRMERRLITIPLMAICAAGVSILAISPSLPVVLASAVVCGIGFGSLQPILATIVVEVAKPRERGAALATFMSSLDIGIAIGSTALGLVAQSAGYPALFLIAGAVVALGLGHFLSYQRSLAPRLVVSEHLPQTTPVSVD